MKDTICAYVHLCLKRYRFVAPVAIGWRLKRNKKQNKKNSCALVQPESTCVIGDEGADKASMTRDHAVKSKAAPVISPLISFPLSMHFYRYIADTAAFIVNRGFRHLLFVTAADGREVSSLIYATTDRHFHAYLWSRAFVTDSKCRDLIANRESHFSPSPLPISSLISLVDPSLFLFRLCNRPIDINVKSIRNLTRARTIA